MKQQELKESAFEPLLTALKTAVEYLRRDEQELIFADDDERDHISQSIKEVANFVHWLDRARQR
jgi:hypothetical protein